MGGRKSPNLPGLLSALSTAPILRVAPKTTTLKLGCPARPAMWIRRCCGWGPASCSSLGGGLRPRGHSPTPAPSRSPWPIPWVVARPAAHAPSWSPQSSWRYRRGGRIKGEIQEIFNVSCRKLDENWPDIFDSEEIKTADFWRGVTNVTVAFLHTFTPLLSLLPRPLVPEQAKTSTRSGCGSARRRPWPTRPSSRTPRCRRACASGASRLSAEAGPKPRRRTRAKRRRRFPTRRT